MVKICDYSGHACACEGFQPQAKGSKMCVCGHFRSQHFERIDEMGDKLLMATFRRQVWVNDEAMDTEAPVEFDATQKFLVLPLWGIRTFREHDYDSDYLAETLPERMEWTGPFEVDVDIDGWLEKNGIPDGRKSLTQEDLDRLRKEYGVS